MTAYSFPSVTPYQATYRYVSNTISHRSWLSNFVQSQGFGAEILTATLFFRLPLAQRNELVGWYAQMNGSQNRCVLPVYKQASRGSFGGTPLVNGGNQVGTQLLVDGCSNNISPWIRRGDYFSIGTELKICTEDASSNGSGEVTIKFRPRIRVSPNDGSGIDVTTPTGRFIIATPELEWGVTSDHDVSETSIQFVEDVL